MSLYFFIRIFFLFLLFHSYNYNPQSVFSSDSLFPVSMGIKEFRAYIFNKFALSSRTNPVLSYSFSNYQFILKGNMSKNFYYSNENIKLTLNKNYIHHHYLYNNFFKINLQLKKVFSYLLCNKCQKDESSIFPKPNNLHPLVYENVKSKYGINDFFYRMVYYVISLPIEKLNPIIKKVYISFFNKKIFRITYYLDNTSLFNFSILKENLSKKYIPQKDSKKFFIFKSKDLSQTIYLSKKYNKNFEYSIHYYQKDLNTKYLNYLERIKNNLSKLLLFNKFQFLFPF